MKDLFACQVCNKNQLQLIKGFDSLPRITSDCKPFPTGGKLAVCMVCGAVQKIPDPGWLQEISQIYADYEAYSIANGEEQLVLDPITGTPIKRSTLLLDRIATSYSLPDTSKAIDIGCGGGVTLKAMSAKFPTWKLYGHELESNKFNYFATIPGFQTLFTGKIADIQESFDLITMIHSLEHFVQPLETLKQLRSKMEPQGYLFVEVCNIEENPFDILVADHLMHFSPHAVSNMAKQAGFLPGFAHTDWVKKEISFMSKVGEVSEIDTSLNPETVFNQISAYVAWLNALLQHAKNTALSTPSFGIFGTSVAASWLATELSDHIQFFVDEDPNRVGRQYMNKPILSPQHVPNSSAVYLALAPALSSKIAQRLSNNVWSFIQAPPL